MRLCARNGHAGRPIWSAWNPKMSATVSSKYACSRSFRYPPSGVASHAANVIDRVSAATEGSSKATIIPIPAFRDNYIWAVRNGTLAAVVDPGDAAPVLAWLDANGVQLTAILATHHHADHDGDRIDVPGVDLALSVLDIPGHTAGHIAYYALAPEPLVFCGDTLFAAGCGRLFEGTPPQMWSSLRKLAALPAATRVYCGHEYTLANLRFAAAVEPGNEDIRARTENEREKRTRDEPTVPSTTEVELATSP